LLYFSYPSVRTFIGATSLGPSRRPEQWRSDINIDGDLISLLRLIALEIEEAKWLTILTTLLWQQPIVFPYQESIWEDLSALKASGETFDQLLERMIDAEKERRFFEDVERIEK